MFDDLKSMRTPDGHAAVEFHDSTLVRIQRQDADRTLVLDAYVHRSAGTPGTSPGSGWSQAVHLYCRRARILPSEPTLPLLLADGVLTTQRVVLENVVPVPSSFSGQVHLELVGCDGERIVVDAECIELAADGEPTYVDEFAGHLEEP